MFATYLFSRCLEVGMNYSDKHNIVKKIPFFEIPLLGIVTSVLFYTFFYEFYAFPKGADKIFYNLASPACNDDI
jgi:hypothetical protein